MFTLAHADARTVGKGAGKDESSEIFADVGQVHAAVHGSIAQPISRIIGGW